MKLFLPILILLSIFSTTHAKTNTDILNIGYYESPPFVYTAPDGSLTGISIWMWNAINEEMKLPYTMKYVPLTEVINQLEAGSIDICLNPLSVTSARLSQANFSYPFFVSNSSAAVHQVSAFKKGKILLASFFSFNFFSAVFALLLIILFFGFLVWLFERKRNPEQFRPNLHGIMSGLWWSAVTMTTVGYGDKSPQTFWGRTVALIWMFTAVIILSSFTASIASSLTVNHLNWNKNSILEYKDDKIGVIDGSATETWLRKRFFSKIKVYSSIPNGLDAVKQHKITAFLHDEPILRHYIKQTNHADEIEILTSKFNLQFYSYGFSKMMDTRLKDDIILNLAKITEGSDWGLLLSEYDLTLQ